MKRISFEDLEKLSDFEVDARRVHGKSANITIIKLKEKEELDLEPCDFQIHIAVLDGAVSMISSEKAESFKTGCLASILPGIKVKFKALVDSRLLIIKDDPLWVLRERRSVRKFSKAPVSKETIVKIVKESLMAPSGGNLQPWRIYAISDEEKKKALERASYGQEHVSQAPWVLVVTAVPSESGKEYGERGEKLYSIQDTASLTTYIMLVAKAYGLDTCWVGAFKDEEVWKVIGSPEGEVPVSIIPIGYGAEKPEPPERKPVESVLKFL